MHGIIIDGSQQNCPDALAGRTRTWCRWYGIDHVITLSADDDLSELFDEHPADGDVVVICSDRHLTPAVVRLLTLRSVRIPAHLVVWSPGDGGIVVAARLAPADLLQMNYHNFSDFQDELRKLTDIEKLPRYAVEDIIASGAVRVGGSFAKSGVRQYFSKHADGLGSRKLRDEALFYARLPEALRSRYPELLFSHTEGSPVRLGLEYVDQPNLRDLLLDLRIQPDRASSVLEQVLDYEYNHAYLEYLQETPPGYVQDYHFDRVWSRLAVTIDLDADFDTLIRSRRLQLNGRLMPNIPAMLFQLEQDTDAIRELAPPGVSPHIHGDLHLENILYDQAADEFWLVDPRGYSVCDIYYDLGKLAHSYNGRYDLLHEGRHQVAYHTENDTAALELSLNSAHLERLYSQLERLMHGVVANVLRSDIAELAPRINFNEAMHFCCDMPFHIHPDASPNVAVAIYATGALLLAGVLDEFSIEPDYSEDTHRAGLQRMEDTARAKWRLAG